MSTNFQEQVWDIIRNIPAGKIATYGQIARALGRPQSMRAVGNALNKNPYAPVVPCHRVVRSDGKIGGYNADISKKIALLKKEGVMVHNERILNFKSIICKFN